MAIWMRRVWKVRWSRSLGEVCPNDAARVGRAEKREKNLARNVSQPQLDLRTDSDRFPSVHKYLENGQEIHSFLGQVTTPDSTTQLRTRDIVLALQLDWQLWAPFIDIRGSPAGSDSRASPALGRHV